MFIREFAAAFKEIADKAGWDADEQVLSLMSAIDAHWPEDAEMGLVDEMPLILNTVSYLDEIEGRRCAHPV